MEKYFKDPRVVCLLAMVSCFLWGSAFPGIKIGYRLLNIESEATATQIYFAGSRFFLAGIIVIAIFSVMRKDIMRPKNMSEVRHICVISAFQTVAQYMLFYIGMAYANSARASVIDGTNVFFALIVACLVFRQEKFTARKLAACLIGFMGVVMMHLSPDKMIGGSYFGEMLVIASTIAYAFSSSIMKIYAKHDDPVMLSGYQFLFGGAVMMAVGKAAGAQPLHWEAASLMMLIYLACVSAVAYTIWGTLLKHNPVSKVAIFCFMTPVFGTVLSVVVLKEQGFDPIMGAVALSLITAGIIISNLQKRENK